MFARWFPVFVCVLTFALLSGCNTPDEGQPIKMPPTAASGSGPAPAPTAKPAPAPTPTPPGPGSGTTPGSATSGSTAPPPPTTPAQGTPALPPQTGSPPAPGTTPPTPVTPTPNPAAGTSAVPPGMEQVKAQAGMTKQGSSLADVQGVIVTPAKAFFAARDKLVFTAQIPQTLNLYKAAHDGKGPQTHEEFMREIIQANQIQLPSLNEGSSYVYDPQTEEIMIRRPQP